MNSKGFTTLEAIASLFIVSLILVSSLGALINYRYQTVAANNRIVAFQVAQMIQENITKNSTYTDLSVWVGSTPKTVTSSTCLPDGAPISCTVFDYIVNGRTYAESVQITFFPPDTEGALYQILEFEVIINYQETRQVEIRGLVYA